MQSAVKYLAMINFYQMFGTATGEHTFDGGVMTAFDWQCGFIYRDEIYRPNSWRGSVMFLEFLKTAAQIIVSLVISLLVWVFSRDLLAKRKR